MSKHCCVTCGKENSINSKRCITCANHLKKGKPRPGKARFGKLAPAYKDGRCLKHLNCIDCNKKLTTPYAIRCKKCSSLKTAKKRMKNRRSYIGKNNPNWKEGISKLPYPYYFSEKLKLQIRIRDNFKCQCCGINELEHKKKYSDNLYIHHIDYNKENCKEDNLITTCLCCNSKANGDRDYWYAYYTYIMENR